MKKSRIVASTAVALLALEVFIARGALYAQEKPDKAAAPEAAMAKCPVSGKPVNLAVSAPTPDGPVFFCCKDCVATYKAEPAKFTEAVATQRAVLAQRPKVQVKCPVSGDPVDPKFALEKDGKKVRFCSDDCRKKYAADPGKYASALANSHTFQTTCPVMNEPIDPAAFMKLPGGETVYLCCKGCDKKLLADPEKYAPGFLKQGFVFDFAKPQKDEKKPTQP